MCWCCECILVSSIIGYQLRMISPLPFQMNYNSVKVPLLILENWGRYPLPSGTVAVLFYVAAVRCNWVRHAILSAPDTFAYAIMSGAKQKPSGGHDWTSKVLRHSGSVNFPAFHNNLVHPCTHHDERIINREKEQEPQLLEMFNVFAVKYWQFMLSK